MAEQLIFDLDRPTSNVALNRLRLAVLSTDDLYLLIDALLGLLDDATADRGQLRADLDATTATLAQTSTALDALTARVAALEPAPVVADPLPPPP